MIRSLGTFVYGVIAAALIIIVALFAAVYVIGLAGKAALFGEPRMTLALRIIERVNKQRKKQRPTVITHITPDNGESE